MARGRYSYFVLFAEMRTGSNFLEQNINQYPDLSCFGELFNPHFVGGPNRDDVFGVTLAQREQDPYGLLDKIKQHDPAILPGFRFFNDHDPRILLRCLKDRDCAKVILTRNALDSYVSRKIAAETNQWKLTNIKHQKSARIRFDLAEFQQHLDATQAFQLEILHDLQVSGQTAFYLNYDDIHDLEVLNGLAAFLGSDHQAEAVKKNLKRQNPEPLSEKVVNYDEMLSGLREIDFLDLSRTPAFEPRRGAGVPQFLAGSRTPMLFIPIKGGPVSAVSAWMTGHNGGGEQALVSGLNQKTLRMWREDNPGFQSFTVLRHPVARAYAGFCRHVLGPQNGGGADLRDRIRRDHNVLIPDEGAEAKGYDLATHKAAFLAFLKFLKANLADQTGLRVHAAWASQTAILEGSASLLPPSHIIHEDHLARGLAHIENLLGLPRIPFQAQKETKQPFALDAVYDQDIENRLRDIYQRDYLNFGFSDWQP